MTGETVGKIEELDGGCNKTYVLNYGMASQIDKWDYKWLYPSELTERGMNDLGEEGWEFVGMLAGDWAIFKRKKPEKNFCVFQTTGEG